MATNTTIFLDWTGQNSLSLPVSTCQDVVFSVPSYTFMLTYRSDMEPVSVTAVSNFFIYTQALPSTRIIKSLILIKDVELNSRSISKTNLVHHKSVPVFWWACMFQNQDCTLGDLIK